MARFNLPEFFATAGDIANGALAGRQAGQQANDQRAQSDYTQMLQSQQLQNEQLNQQREQQRQNLALTGQMAGNYEEGSPTRLMLQNLMGSQFSGLLGGGSQLPDQSQAFLSSPAGQWMAKRGRPVDQLAAPLRPVQQTPPAMLGAAGTAQAMSGTPAPAVPGGGQPSSNPLQLNPADLANPAESNWYQGPIEAYTKAANDTKTYTQDQIDHYNEVLGKLMQARAKHIPHAEFLKSVPEVGESGYGALRKPAVDPATVRILQNAIRGGFKLNEADLSPEDAKKFAEHKATVLNPDLTTPAGVEAASEAVNWLQGAVSGHPFKTPKDIEAENALEQRTFEKDLSNHRQTYSPKSLQALSGPELYQQLLTAGHNEGQLQQRAQKLGRTDVAPIFSADPDFQRMTETFKTDPAKAYQIAREITSRATGMTSSEQETATRGFLNEVGKMSDVETNDPVQIAKVIARHHLTGVIDPNEPFNGRLAENAYQQWVEKIPSFAKMDAAGQRAFIQQGIALQRAMKQPITLDPNTVFQQAETAAEKRAAARGVLLDDKTRLEIEKLKDDSTLRPLREQLLRSQVANASIPPELKLKGGALDTAETTYKRALSAYSAGLNTLRHPNQNARVVSGEDWGSFPDDWEKVLDPARVANVQNAMRSIKKGQPLTDAQVTAQRMNNMIVNAQRVKGAYENLQKVQGDLVSKYGGENAEPRSDHPYMGATAESLGQQVGVARRGQPSPQPTTIQLGANGRPVQGWNRQFENVLQNTINAYRLAGKPFPNDPVTRSSLFRAIMAGRTQ